MGAGGGVSAAMLPAFLSVLSFTGKGDFLSRFYWSFLQNELPEKARVFSLFLVCVISVFLHGSGWPAAGA